MALSQVAVAALGRVQRTEVSGALAPKLRLDFPQHGSKIALGHSGRVMVKIVGGNAPYYLLVNDELQAHSEYFEPTRNGVHHLTIIDASGANVSCTITIDGLSAKIAAQE